MVLTDGGDEEDTYQCYRLIMPDSRDEDEESLNDRMRRIHEAIDKTRRQPQVLARLHKLADRYREAYMGGEKLNHTNLAQELGVSKQTMSENHKMLESISKEVKAALDSAALGTSEIRRKR